MITRSYTSINVYYTDNRTGEVDLEENIDSVDYLMVKRAYFGTYTIV